MNIWFNGSLTWGAMSAIACLIGCAVAYPAMRMGVSLVILGCVVAIAADGLKTYTEVVMHRLGGDARRAIILSAIPTAILSSALVLASVAGFQVGNLPEMPEKAEVTKPATALKKAASKNPEVKKPAIATKRTHLEIPEYTVEIKF